MTSNMNWKAIIIIGAVILSVGGVWYGREEFDRRAEAEKRQQAIEVMAKQRALAAAKRAQEETMQRELTQLQKELAGLDKADPVLSAPTRKRLLADIQRAETRLDAARKVRQALEAEPEGAPKRSGDAPGR